MVLNNDYTGTFDTCNPNACPEYHVKATTPKLCTHVVPAYSKVPAAIVFENDSGRLFIAGNDRCVKMWDLTTSKLTLKRKYKGCHGLVKDFSITRDNNYIIAASSTHYLYVWNAS